MVSSNQAKNKRAFADTLKSARLGLPDAQYEVGLMYANGVGVARDIEQAVHWIRQSAQKGVPTAQYLLGTRYETGVGVEQSEHQALVWYAKSAEQGHIKALLRAGKLHVKPHWEQAVALYRQAAQAGLAEAQFALGQAYAAGKGVDQNYLLAVRWLSEAAQQGLATAQFAIAEMHIEGHGVARDPKQALVWLRKAARQNHLGAQVALEQMDQSALDGEPLRVHAHKRPGQAERRKDEARWIQAAENGNADARYHLGLMYAQGLGLDADPQEAMHWYSVAAQQGHAKAQWALAELLEQQGSPQALEWYHKAAEAGLPGAQCALGRWYRDGRWVDADPLKSQHWFARAADQGWPQALMALSQLLDSDTEALSFDYCRRAAEGGDPQAMHALALKYERGVGVHANPVRAYVWFEKAAQHGIPAAESATGVALLKGTGVTKDLQAAMRWLLKASDHGDARAQWTLGSVYASGGEGVARDLKQAFVWCQRAADQGFVAAQSNLGLLYALLGQPEQAAASWQKAASQADPEALFNLAMVRLKGQGVPADEVLAFELLAEAAEQGLVQAQSRLGLMYATGQGVAQDSVEAHKWFELAARHGDAPARANLQRSEAVNSPAQVAEGARRARAWEKRQKPLVDTKSKQ
jgi:TPR repeat protein